MSIKRYKPTTPGQRHMSVVDYSVITTKKRTKALCENLKKTSGRNMRRSMY